MGSEMAKRYEVTIVGGGLAGMTLACALADRGIATAVIERFDPLDMSCLLYTSPSPRDLSTSRMPSSA